ncbi:hypothetical protein OSB04_011999 [Centaurea solstitialis]|uniref:protein disulfide-isomerase n=1 Tax=Centaurea solstitialis TaxID=347529 RepID=A0AA38TAJ5_9ASTR|nr:hypothetical protein OSB04_011999 [Centaurea solstitialis]
MSKKSQIHLITLATTLALFLISSCVADVVVLTADNFENEVGKDRGALVEFYAPWCGHCKKIAPFFEQLGILVKKTKSVLAGKVDCDENKELCTKYGVSGYPTIKWFPEGSLEPKDYEGSRTVDGFAEFINKEAGTNIKVGGFPSHVVALTTDNFDEIVMDKTKDVFVEFYATWCGHCKALAPIYESLGTAYKNERDVVIANLDGDRFRSLAERFDITGYPTMKFFPKDNKAGEDYNGGRELKSLVEFINQRCGTSRDAQGHLTSDAGIVEVLHDLVKEFMGADGDEKKAVFAKIQEEAGNLHGSFARYGNIYIKAAQSCMAKGADYARNEIQRLERMLSKSISSLKADEFIVKKNVLSAFA